MAQNANQNSKERISADEIRPPDAQLPVVSQLDQTPAAQFSDRGSLRQESVNRSNFADTCGPHLMFNLCCDDSHQNMQMLLDKLKNIENEVTGARHQLSLTAERIANRLERLELDVVGIGRQLGAFDVAIDSTVDRIESLEDGFSHMRPQLFATEESLEGLVSMFDSLENEVVKIGYQLSNDVDKLAKTVENHPRKT